MKRQKAKHKELGFAHIGIVIAAVLVIAALIFAGWWVWDKSVDDTESVNNTASTSEQQQAEPLSQTNVVANWVSLTAKGGGFSMKVPDGWKLTRFPDGLVGGLDITHMQGEPAIIEDSETEYVGHLLVFRAGITQLDDAGLGPQWVSPQQGLQESTEDFSVGTLKGKRYKAIFTIDSNKTLYEYVFSLGDNKKLDIVYTVDHSKDAVDEVSIVEQAIKTIEIE